MSRLLAVLIPGIALVLAGCSKPGTTSQPTPGTFIGGDWGVELKTGGDITYWQGGPASYKREDIVSLSTTLQGQPVLRGKGIVLDLIDDNHMGIAGTVLTRTH